LIAEAAQQLQYSQQQNRKAVRRPSTVGLVGFSPPSLSLFL
jgi:hypothetical protein